MNNDKSLKNMRYREFFLDTDWALPYGKVGFGLSGYSGLNRFYGQSSILILLNTQ